MFFNKSSFLRSLSFSSLLLELMKPQRWPWNNGAISVTAGWRKQIRDGNWGGAGGEAVGAKFLCLCNEISHYWWLGRKHLERQKESSCANFFLKKCFFDSLLMCRCCCRKRPQTSLGQPLCPRVNGEQVYIKRGELASPPHCSCGKSLIQKPPWHDLQLRECCLPTLPA